VLVKALIDSGSTLSGFSPRVFDTIGLTPVGRLAILTPSTPAGAPHEVDLYDVELSIIANGVRHPFSDSQLMAADCWHPDEGILALIGLDILDGCFFQYHGPNRVFSLGF
jgi:hypothetical protein